MKYISIEYILKLHDKLIKATGGAKEIRAIDQVSESISDILNAELSSKTIKA
ncbi:death on curing protein [Clostridium sp. BJN0013]|uniref:death on curing protein n=1 Tax=Clostridium sp. BJN0013 TaxID=3236840 RepID=UPI0034C6444B